MKIALLCILGFAAIGALLWLVAAMAASQEVHDPRGSWRGEEDL